MKVFSALLACTLASVSFGVWMFHPPLPNATDVASADTVVVVAGADDGRHALAAEVAEDRPLFVSNPRGDRDRPGFQLCARMPTATCFAPEPRTTAGEAQAVTGRGQHYLVVTNRPHARRVAAIFERCTGSRVTVLAVPRIEWKWAGYQVVREALGFVKWWTTRPCG